MFYQLIYVHKPIMKPNISVILATCYLGSKMTTS